MGKRVLCSQEWELTSRPARGAFSDEGDSEAASPSSITRVRRRPVAPAPRRNRRIVESIENEANVETVRRVRVDDENR